MTEDGRNWTPRERNATKYFESLTLTDIESRQGAKEGESKTRPVKRNEGMHVASKSAQYSCTDSSALGTIRFYHHSLCVHSSTYILPTNLRVPVALSERDCSLA